jgi:putative transposase
VEALQQGEVDKITLLVEFIRSNPDARELKRALAVKIALEGGPYFNIAKLLGIHKSCITY